MLFNKNALTPDGRRNLVIAVIFFLAGTAGFSLVGLPVIAGLIMVFSAVVIVFYLLEMKTDRMFKGYCLVAFGAFIVGWHAMLFATHSMSEVATETLKLMVQLFTLSCAGAGGSLIAAHGDTSSTDREVQVQRFTLTSDSQRILDLQKLTLKQTRWIKTLCFLAFLVLVLVGVVLSIVLRS